VGSATGVVERRPTCVGLAGAKGKGFGAGRVKSGKLFFTGNDSRELVRRAVGVEVLRRELTCMALSMDGEKSIVGTGGAVLEDVPHLTDWLPDLPVRIRKELALHCILLCALDRSRRGDTSLSQLQGRHCILGDF